MGVGFPRVGSPALHQQARSRRTLVALDTVSTIFTGPLTWTADGACVGQTNLFFAPAGERPETRVPREARARAVCRSCPASRCAAPAGP